MILLQHRLVLSSLTMRVDRGLSDMMRGNTLNAMIMRSLEFSHRSILAMVSTEWYDVVVHVPSSAPEYLNLDLVAANDTMVVDTGAAANVFLSDSCGKPHNTFLRRVVGASKGMAMSLRRSVRICTDCGVMVAKWDPCHIKGQNANGMHVVFYTQCMLRRIHS